MPCKNHGPSCDQACVDPNVDNGMMTKVWGPTGWLFLHCVTFGYPYAINSDNKMHSEKIHDYYKFFYYLGKVLPCKYCRDSYMEYFTENDLSEKLKTRKDLCKWLYDIHNKINNKLGVPDCNIPTFEQVQDKYEEYRAKCKKTTNEEREKNKTKGCVDPADGTPKKLIMKIIKGKKGDVTRRTNAQLNTDDYGNSDDYMVLHIPTITNYLFIFVLILIASIIYTYAK